MTHFGEGGFAEVAHFQKLVLAARHEVAHRHDVFRFEAIAGPHREVQLGERHAELGIERRIDPDGAVARRGADLRAKLNACTSNKEYDILRGQIEADEVANSVLEDEILELLEKVDQTQREIAEADSRAKQLQAECSTFAEKVSQESVGLQARASGLSEQIRTAEPVLAGDNLVVPGYERLDLHVGYDGFSNLDLSLLIRNVTDERYIERPNSAYLYGHFFGSPRAVMLRAQYDF